MMARSDVMIGILIVMNLIQHMLVQPATNLPKLNTKVVFVILPLHLVYSLTTFPKLNKDVISECPINYEDVYMKMLNISCQNGTRWACVPDARNSAEMLSFCKPADLECPAGTTGSFTANGDTVTMEIETCPPETYKKHVSDCADACHQKRTDFFQIPKEFAVYSNGSNTEPPQIYCNASAGWYNNNNKTFFDFDSDFTFELGYKIMCLNVKDQNPCVNGLLVLPNGTCVNQQQRDHFMLQLERNNIDGGSRNNKSNITIQPSTTTAERVKTTTEPSSNNLTSEGNSTQVKSWFNQETIFKIAGTLGGVPFILCVSLLSYYVWRRHRQEKGYQPVARKEIKNEQNEATGRPDENQQVASENMEMKENQATERPNVVNSCRGEPLKKKNPDGLNENIIQRLYKLMPRVGALVFKTDLQGTVFRVGENYLITALHVISNFIAYRDTDGNLCIEDDRLKRLDMIEDLYVSFGPAFGVGPKFSVKYCYHIQRLDLIIMTITVMADTNEPLPEPVNLDKHDRPMTKVSAVGYGNRKDPSNKNVDNSCKVILESDPVIRNAAEYLRVNLNKFAHIDKEIVAKGYKYNANDIILYHGSLEQGASGAPLFYLENGFDRVVGVVLEALPALYYYLNPNERHLIPDEYVFFVAVKTSSIYKALEENGKAELAKELFPEWFAEGTDLHAVSPSQSRYQTESIS